MKGILQVEPKNNGFPVVNCRDCGRLFTRYSGKTCPDCRAVETRMMESVISYLRARPGADIEQVSIALGIPLAKVTQFAQEGVFRRYELNATYPCRICMAEISKGIICLACNDSLNQHIESLREAEWQQQAERPGNYERHERPSENIGTLQERKPGSWGNADDLFADGVINSRRDRDKKTRRTATGGFIGKS